MPTIKSRCPYCFATYTVDQAFTGRPFQCSSPKCGKTFKATPHAAPAEPEEHFAEAGEHLDESGNWVQTGSDHLTLSRETIAAISGRNNPPAKPATPPATPVPAPTAPPASERYVNLKQYLSVIHILARFFRILGIGVGVFIAIGPTIAYQLPPPWEVVAFGFGVAAVAYGQYVITMAGVEFVRVIMDIEANTRAFMVSSTK